MPALSLNEMIDLLDAAKTAGMTAAREAEKTAPIMRVVQRANPFDNTSPIVYQGDVFGGPCGFAWVKIKPATSRFAKFLVANKFARSSYGGGIQVWCPLPSQSMYIKEAWGAAFANVLREAGFNAWMESRMD